MGKKNDNNEKKTKQKAKKKDVEFNFTSLRKGLSQKGKKELIDFFTNAKQVFSQSKAELLQLNKRFDNLEFVFKELFKKDNINLTINQEAIIRAQQVQVAIDSVPKNNEEEYVISKDYLASIFNEENSKEDEKSKEELRKIIEEEEDNISVEEQEFKPIQQIMKTREKPKTKEKLSKNQIKKNNMIQDDFDKKDSSESNENQIKNNSKPIIDNFQSKDFNQKLFDYKSFSNSQNKKDNSPSNKDQSAKKSNTLSSWIIK